MPYNQIAMKRVTRYFRPLVACLLALSIAAVGYCSPACGMMSRCGAACGMGNTQPTCCCGTQGGQFCGMACCAKSSSNQLPVSPAPRANTDEHQPVLLIFMLTGEVNASLVGNRFAGHFGTSLGDAQFSPTLQTQHVRIQT